jgi:esterase/lipase
MESKLTFQSYDGYKLKGTYCAAAKPQAAVLFVHGITSSRDELGFHSDYAHFLADNDISSLRFDYRYHGIFAGKPTQLAGLTLSGIVNDIDAAFLALKAALKTKLPIVIIGTSFGGGLSVFWDSKNKYREVKKILLNAPVINYENDVLERNSLINDGLLIPKSQNKLRKDGYILSSGIRFGEGLINELKYINGIQPLKELANKITIFHGDADEDVPLTSSKKYKAKETDIVIIKNVGHGFGVDGDEDLDFPETKAIHKSIYEMGAKIILGTA